MSHKQDNTKDTNPKDAVGVRKWRQFCTIPFPVMWEIGVAMLEGARKYGRHNYRVAGVRASVYIDAAMGHLTQWWEGEDLDPESGLNHITKALASLAVLRDAMLNDMCTDDRPPKAHLSAIRDSLQAAVNEVMDRYPIARLPFTQLETPVAAGSTSSMRIEPVEGSDRIELNATVVESPKADVGEGSVPYAGPVCCGITIKQGMEVRSLRTQMASFRTVLASYGSAAIRAVLVGSGGAPHELRVIARFEDADLPNAHTAYEEDKLVVTIVRQDEAWYREKIGGVESRIFPDWNATSKVLYIRGCDTSKDNRSFLVKSSDMDHVVSNLMEACNVPDSGGAV